VIFSAPAPPQTGLAAALDALHRRDFTEAGTRFAELACQGQSEAMRYLGLLHLRGLGVEYDPFEAFRWTEEAVRTGSPSAARLTLASLYYLGLGTARNITLAQTLLLDAARTGDPAALRTLGLVYLGLGPAWHKQAHACLASAAADRDVFAVHAIAVMRLIEGHTAAALPILSWAGTRGLIPSLLRLKALQNRIGAKMVRDLAVRAPHQPERPRRLPIRRFTWKVFIPDPVVALEPRISLAIGTNLLHPVECDYLMALAAPHLKPEVTTHPDGKAAWSGKVTAMQFTRRLEDLVLFGLEERIAAFSGTVWDGHIPLAIERHSPGPGIARDERTERPGDGPMEPAGPDVKSHHVIARVSLNDGFTGGEVTFPALARTVPATTGLGIVFSSTDSYGNDDPLAAWYEKPVLGGEKWTALFHLHDGQA